MKLTILDLIREVGVDNIVVQPLPECIIGAQVKRPKSSPPHTEITIETDQMTSADLAGNKKYGIIIWMPTEMVAKIQAKYQAMPDKSELPKDSE